jgi:secreted trypsin-like serine protease
MVLGVILRAERNMKVLLVLSAVVALALAEGKFQAAYIPLATEISNDPSLRIVGGQDATRNQFPYQISLQRRVILSLYSHICGGSILSTNWVLTAAHCTHGTAAGNLRVIAGILLLNDANIAGQQTRDASQIINHPSYPGGNQVAPNDISLVRLATPLSYTINVQPIAIPQQGHSSRGTGVLSGWGLLRSGGSTPNHLQFANLPVVPETECNAILTSLLGSNNPFSIALNLCSGTVLGFESACNGDSGGPYVKDGNVIGVVSWGLVPCGDAGAPSVFAKTSAYSNWITTSTGGEVRP